MQKWTLDSEFQQKKTLDIFLNVRPRTGLNDANTICECRLFVQKKRTLLMINGKDIGLILFCKMWIQFYCNDNYVIFRLQI